METEKHLCMPSHAVPAEQGDEQQRQLMINALSDEFTREVIDRLETHELDEVRMKNAEWADPQLCATTEYLDANMVMQDAWDATMNMPIDGDNESHCSIWNAAWALSKERGFVLPSSDPKSQEADA